MPANRTLVQNASRMPREPFIAVQMQFGQFGCCPFLQIGGGSFRPAVDNFVDPAARAVAAVGVVTFAEVVPVRNINAAIRPVLDRHPPKPRIGAEQEVVSVHADVGRSVGNKPVVVHSVAVHVVGEERAAILIGPVIAEVDHATAMCMAAAGHGMVTVTGSRLMPSSATPVKVVRDGLNPTVNIRIVLFRDPPFAVHPVHDVPEVCCDGVGRDQITEFIEVRSPRIHHPVGDSLEGVIDRMKPPNPATHLESLVHGCPWSSNV